MKKVYFSFETGDFFLVNRFRTKLGGIHVEAKFYDPSLKMPCNAVNNELIKERLREKISQCHLIICFITERTLDNPFWVQWEIEEAQRQGKEIAAMKLLEEPLPAPRFLENINIEPVEWSLEILRSWCQ